MATRLAGAWTPLAGGGLTLRLGPHLAVGGAARIALTSPLVARDGSRIRLHFGYAGVTLGWHPEPARWPGLGVTTLLAAGNANAKDPEVHTLLDSSNGFIVEPSASYAVPLGGRAAAAASLSWRFVSGFSLIGGIHSNDLRGPAAGLTVSVGPF